MGDWAGFLINVPLLQEHGWRLLAGLQMTVELVGLACSIGFLLAWPVCRARMSSNRLLSGAALSYITLFRGTPLLCQLYLVYYGAGELRPTLAEFGLWGFFREAFNCCLFAMALNTGAYQGEIFRGAIMAVPKGQKEAAAALGLSRWHVLRHIVFPQALLIALRPLGNELISMIKASAISAIVTLLDLMGQTRFVFAHTFDFSIYLYAALIYLAMTETIRRVWLRIERALSRHLQPARQAAAAAAQRVQAPPAAGDQQLMAVR